jgi:hypothetical protein
LPSVNVDQVEGVQAAPPAPPRSRLRRWLTAAVVLLVIAALAAVLVRGWSAVSQYDWRLDPGWLALGAILVMLAYTVNGRTYGRSVEWLSPVHPPAPLALSIWAKSLLGRYIPGNVMMVIGRAVMAHDQGVPRRVTLAATAYEQALALGVASIGSVIFLAAYGDPGEGNLLWLLAIVPLILAFLHPVPFRKLSTWALRRLGRPPLDTLFTARQVGRLFLYYAAGTVPLVIGVWALARAVAGPGIGGVFEIGLAFLLAFVISFLTFVLPSGIGVRDGILALAMSRHVPGEVALAIAIGLRFVLVLVELVFVALAVLVGRRA